MKEFLRTKGFKMTPQRELIFRSFFEQESHVTVDELYDRVRELDRTVGYATVWRTLKLICKVGLAAEVNLGDGVTRYDKITRYPHGHLYCLECRTLIEFDASRIIRQLSRVADEQNFEPEGYKIEVQGYCPECRKKLDAKEYAKKPH